MEIFSIEETYWGAGFKRQIGLSWESDPATILRPTDVYAHPNAAGDDFDTLNVYHIACQEDLLFVVHFNGLTSVWNWKTKLIVHKYTYYHGTFLFDVHGRKHMQCKHGVFIMGTNGNIGGDQAPVVAWKFDSNNGNKPFSTRICEIRIDGLEHVECLDINAHVAAVAFRTPEDISKIVIWDMSDNRVLQIIDNCPSLRTISLNSNSLVVVKSLSGPPLLEVSQQIITFMTNRGR